MIKKSLEILIFKRENLKENNSGIENMAVNKLDIAVNKSDIAVNTFQIPTWRGG